MAAAKGSSALLNLAFEASYGVVPVTGFTEIPFVSTTLGDEQNLVASDLLGLGREPGDPSLDVINNTADTVVSIDVRNIGLHLKALLGAPTTTPGVRATGALVFSDQPAANATVTINSSVITFVAGSPDAGEVQIGATLAATLANLVYALNASGDANITPASYEADVDGVTVAITYDALGTGGNAFTLAASSAPASNATPSGATLTGGAASGGYQHVFTSGIDVLPSLSAEVCNPDVPTFSMNYGIKYSKFVVNLARSGLLNATISTIAQGEKPPTASSSAGSPAVLAFNRFTQFRGKVLRQGVALGDLVSGSFTFDNGLAAIETIRPDGRIAGIDEGNIAPSGQAVMRFTDNTLYNFAVNGTPIDLLYGWQNSNIEALEFLFYRVFLPKSKRPIQGSAGIQETYNWQGAKDLGANHALKVTLYNDHPSY